MYLSSQHIIWGYMARTDLWSVKPALHPEERSTHLPRPWSCRGPRGTTFGLTILLVGLLDYVTWWGGGDSAPLVYRKLWSRFWLGKRHWTPLIEISRSRYKWKSSKIWLWGAKDSDFFAISIYHLSCYNSLFWLCFRGMFLRSSQPSLSYLFLFLYFFFKSLAVSSE